MQWKAIGVNQPLKRKVNPSPKKDKKRGAGGTAGLPLLDDVTGVQSTKTFL